MKQTSNEARLAADVHRALVGTLYASTTSLAMGAFVGAAMSGTVAYYSGSIPIALCAFSIALVGVIRVGYFIRYKRIKGDMRDTFGGWERSYEIWAWLFAFLLGLNAFLTLFLTDDPSLHLVAASLTAGYTCGIAGRNAGRPVIATGQVLLTGLPPTIAFIIIWTPFSLVLALSNLALIVASLNITQQTYQGVLTAFTEKYEKAVLAEKFEILAKSDVLTGLDNRLMLTEYLERALDPATAGASLSAVFWIDLDHFKEINDTLGHAVGDKVLKETARRLKQIVGEDGYASRFGGDEFVIVMPVQDELAAHNLATAIVTLLSIPYRDENIDLDMSGSVGVSLSEGEHMDAATLLQNADIALYDAKSSGRRGFAIFDRAMSLKLHKQREMQSDLRKAIAADQFEVLYQPIVELKTKNVVSYEALLRWHHPIYGLISPTVFIPIAETIKMIEPLTQMVMNRACLDATHWDEHIKINVNISPSMLKGRGLPHIIQSALLNSGMKAKRLCLEITESVLIEDNVNAIHMLKQFQKMGISLSLDDFGTGYSSLSYVCKYSFNSLKIDKSFVSDIRHSSESRAVIDAVMGLGASLNMTVVAEGIETEEDCAYVEQAGCRYVQGYLFGRPEPADRVYHLTGKDKIVTPTRLQNQVRIIR